MTILTVTVDDDEVESLKQKLNEYSSVKYTEDKTEAPLLKPESALERIKKILDEAKGKNLFSHIEDPSEWQREIRKEWDRDF